MNMSDIKKMSVAERLHTMELLWDSFANDDIKIDSPAWHGEILSQRKVKIASGQANFVSLDTLKKFG